MQEESCGKRNSELSGTYRSALVGGQEQEGHKKILGGFCVFAEGRPVIQVLHSQDRMAKPDPLDLSCPLR